MRWVALLLLSMWSPESRAGDLALALRTGDWQAAARYAATAPDPVAPRLVRYLKVLTPGAATASEILDEMVEEPEWPLRSVLARRYSDALAGERDDAVAGAMCRRRAPDTVPALLRCAGTVVHGEEFARLAWLEGITDAAGEAAFLKRWGSAVGAELQAARFERLAWSEGTKPDGPLARQAVRVDPALRPAAEARLALMRGDPAGPGLFAILPARMQADPGLVLALARWFRRADRDVEAAQIWAERGGTAEAMATERRGAFWSERNLLARRLLRTGQNQLAFAVAAAGSGADALFLSGWIALRRLNEPVLAAARFRALAESSEASITQGRAFYWLGRALAAGGDPDAARDAYRRGAGWATTYYGQLAALASGETMSILERRIGTMNDPQWNEVEALDFASTEMARAATLLAAWGQRGRAKAFLGTFEGRQANNGGRSIVARFAAALDLPDQAVALARLAGREGVMLPQVGWPENVETPLGAVERAVALGVVRQESSFDASARSSAGAIGLMQLMPTTAASVARELGLSGVLTDAVYNVRLGTAYLKSQVERFGALPPALAAYNAGPSRVKEWIASNGDPATAPVDPIDWVELIPFDETRNYVQRIIENVLIYRARAGVVLPHPVVAWSGNGI